MEEVKAALSQTFGAATEHVHEIYTQERADKTPNLAWIDMQCGRSAEHVPVANTAGDCAREVICNENRAAQNGSSD